MKIVWKIEKKFMQSNELILKTKQRFKSERRNVFTEEINKIVLSSNNDNDNSVEIYGYGMNKDLVCKKEEIKCNNIIKQNKNA